MSLLLNVCRSRVAESEPIQSQCTANTTISQAKADADALLCSPARDHADCTRAQCESDEINTGKAIGATSLKVARNTDGSLKLTWGPPVTDASDAVSLRYRVYRRTESESAFTQIAVTSGRSYTDTTAAGKSFQYEISVIW